MRKCSVCHYPPGANFCPFCGHITERGRKAALSSPCACEGEVPLAEAKEESLYPLGGYYQLVLSWKAKEGEVKPVDVRVLVFDLPGGKP